MKIILASQSPRRKQILNDLGVNFEVVVSDCDENTNKQIPEEIVMDLSKQKAMNVYARVNKKAIIVAADTIVCLDKKILGKPKDKNEAFEMINKLQDKWHTVYTGVCIIKDNGDIENYYEKTDVHFRHLTEIEIWNYINIANPLDKAGAYGVQDQTCNFVDEVKGEIETVIGLPVIRLKNVLA